MYRKDFGKGGSYFHLRKWEGKEVEGGGRERLEIYKYFIYNLPILRMRLYMQIVFR